MISSSDCVPRVRGTRVGGAGRGAWTLAAGFAAVFACGSCALAQDGGLPGLPPQGFPAPPAQGYPDPMAAAGAGSSAATPEADPPARVVRLSFLNGEVSTEPASVNAFSPAELNQVLTSGDRVYTDTSAGAELQSGQLAVRLAGGADLTVTAMTDTLAQFGLAAGSVHLRSFAIDPGTVLELDTPDAALTVLQPGDVRVDVDAAAHTSTIELLTGQVQVDSPGNSQVLTPGQRLRLHGADPDSGTAAYAENLPPAGQDALDSFSGDRDNLYASGEDAESPYLNADTIGGADLGSYGSWDSSDYGPIWYPVVAVGWVPYCTGHWRWVAPWGWTWVGPEPWGFAPFHYGRWANLNGRWGWIPGPRMVRPIYAPALVAFAGGPQFSASLGYAPGLGITAWFPLGPHEPYAPWYHGSTLYLNRVNASNLYDPNPAEVRAFYNQRAVNVFTSGPLATRNYVNRVVGTVAVPETAFAAGRQVETAQLRIPRQTLASAPILPHPMVTPERSMVVSGTARAMPTVAARPFAGAGAEGFRSGEAGQPLGTALVHRAVPPSEGRPSFEEERRAMQNMDPGRPLSPGQVQNLRESRPAGPPSSREAIPHPAPAPAPRAAPRSAPAPAPSSSATRH